LLDDLTALGLENASERKEWATKDARYQTSSNSLRSELA
jgi:hypothetical protein